MLSFEEILLLREFQIKMSVQKMTNASSVTGLQGFKYFLFLSIDGLNFLILDQSEIDKK